MYLVFCVSCNLSGCTRYQAKFTEMLKAKYSTDLGRVTPDHNDEAQNQDADNGRVLDLQ